MSDGKLEGTMTRGFPYSNKRRGRLRTGFGLLIVLSLSLVLNGSVFNAYSQEEEPTEEDLERELNKTLKAIEGHFERIQEHLDAAGVERDPDLDKAIEELKKEQQSLTDRFEGLGTVLLDAHREKEKPIEGGSDTSFEDVEEEFFLAIEAIEAYIKEREEYWADREEVDPEIMLEEELQHLQAETERLEEMLAGLEAALADAWEDVTAGWGDVLKDWEDSVNDLIPEEE
jgi:hypothetical protein